MLLICDFNPCMVFMLLLPGGLVGAQKYLVLKQIEICLLYSNYNNIDSMLIFAIYLFVCEGHLFPVKNLLERRTSDETC